MELTGRAEPSPVTMAFAKTSAPCSRNHADRRTIRCAMPNTTRACKPVVAPQITDAPGSSSRNRWNNAIAAINVDFAALRPISR